MTMMKKKTRRRRRRIIEDIKCIKLNISYKLAGKRFKVGLINCF